MKNPRKQKELENIVNRPELNKPVGIIRLEMVRESRSLYGAGPFTSPVKAVEMVKPLLVKADREMVVVVSLNTKLDALAAEVVAVGGLDSCCLDIRNVYKHSLLNNAACIMCFHNHPSGQSEPSKEDYQMTWRLKEAGQLLGITLADHIIIGDGNYFSFKEHGELDGGPTEPAA